MFSRRQEDQKMEALVTALRTDVKRLADVVKRQQEVIVEYAYRSQEVDNAFTAVDLDRPTSLWLEQQFGRWCARVKEGNSGNELSVFNTVKNMEKVRSRAAGNSEVTSWLYDAFVKAENAGSADNTVKALKEDVATMLHVVFGDDIRDPSRVPGMDLDAVKAAAVKCLEIRAQHGGAHSVAKGVMFMQSVASCVTHLEPEGERFAKILSVDVLAAILAALAFDMEGTQRTDFFLEKSDPLTFGGFVQGDITAKSSRRLLTEVLESAEVHELGLTEVRLEQLRDALGKLAAGATPEEHWNLVGSLDNATRSVLEKSKLEAGHTFSNIMLMSRVITQGIFCASLHGGSGGPCREHFASDAWVVQSTAQMIAQGREERTRGLEENPFSRLVGDGGAEATPLAQALLGLNVVDFLAAPLWTCLQQHIPAMQEATGLLLINRARWANIIATMSPSAFPAIAGEVQEIQIQMGRRSAAFEQSFTSTRFDPLSPASVKAPAGGSLPKSASGSVIGLLQDRVSKHSSSGDDDEKNQFSTNDFIMTCQESLRATGASTDFLMRLNKVNEVYKDHVRFSLAQTIGFMEESFEKLEENKRGNLFNVPLIGRKKDTDKKQESPSEVVGGQGVHRPGAVTQVVPLTEGDFPARKGAKPPSTVLDSPHGPVGQGVVINPTKEVLSSVKKGNTATDAKSDRTRWQVRASELLNHKYTGIVMGAFTVFALFANDLMLALLPKSTDNAFGVITLLAMMAFSLEILLKVNVEPAYKWSFFFWLDFIATISLLPDVPFVWEALLLGVDKIFSTGVGEGSNTSLSYLRAGRASRAGARAARVVRILRLVRLLRILKLYMYVYDHSSRLTDQKEKEKRSRHTSRYMSRYQIKRRMSGADHRVHQPSSAKPDTAQGESKVGAKLADLTTRRVIMLVLVILFTQPVFNPSQEDLTFDVAVGLLHAASVRYYLGQISLQQFDDMLNGYTMNAPDVIYLKFDALNSSRPTYIRNDGTGITVSDLESSFRTAELIRAFQACAVYGAKEEDSGIYKVTFPEASDFTHNQYCAINMTEHPTAYNLTSTGAVSNVQFERISAARNIGQTFFIILLFGGATMMFTYDAHKLVIAPIEKMVKIVEELASNPLATFDNDDSDDENESDMLKAARRANKKKSEESSAYETKLLENCIKKIGSLLRVGFGEAGAQIITTNMDGSGMLDPMVPGNKIQAVFGYCDIRNISTTTDVLREEVMLFINEIASIVHVQVSSFSGQPIRNSGDSFLVVWKKTSSSDEDWTSINEKALISFLKTIVEVERSSTLAKFADDSTTFGKQLSHRIKNFKVSLGFALHIGWAIEGAIGSSRKIDASYVSAHVSLVSNLQKYTGLYNVSLLMSGDFYDLLGEDAQKSCRMVDKIISPFQVLPLAMYTYDCVFSGLSVKLQAVRLKGDDMESEERNTVDRRISLVGASPIIDHNINLATLEKSVFRTDLELRALQWELPPHFLPLCRKGLALYVTGRWAEAKAMLDGAVQLYPEESSGPCGVLLEFMKASNFEAPKDWQGYRKVDPDSKVSWK